MARPKIPLISRRKVLETALRIIDEEGLKSLSIRRLGDELNVNGASFYHHFRNKNDILVGAVQLALADVQTPMGDGESWRVWLPRNTRSMRDALLAHPEIIPILLNRERMHIGEDQLDATAARLEREGVPSSLVLPLIESQEMYAIASAMREIIGYDGIDDDPAHPALTRARKERRMSSDQQFERASLALIEEMSRDIPEAAEPAKRGSSRRGRSRPQVLPAS
jgi:TetR/AcrR family transcriptional regulator, tetracycline repressor protein